jgi:hypothetical protein
VLAGLVAASGALGLAFVAASGAAQDEIAVVGDLGGEVGGELVRELRGKASGVADAAADGLECDGEGDPKRVERRLRRG